MSFDQLKNVFDARRKEIVDAAKREGRGHEVRAFIHRIHTQYRGDENADRLFINQIFKVRAEELTAHLAKPKLKIDVPPLEGAVLRRHLN